MATAHRLTSPFAARIALRGELDAPGAARTSRVQLATVGRWKGHRQGELVITEEHLRSIAAAASSRSSRIAIDYEHALLNPPADGAPAAGWLDPKSIEVDGDALFGTVTWTPRAADRIRGEEFKGFSPVLLFDSPDRVTGEPVPCELHSGALTNDPFLDGMQPVELSRLRALAQGGAPMDEENPEAPPEEASADDSGKMAMLGEMVVQALGLTSVDDALAFLEENMGPEELAKALLEKAGGEAPVEAAPEVMAASRGGLKIVSGEVATLKKKIAALSKRLDLRDAEEAVINDGVPRTHPRFGEMVKLSRNSPDLYGDILPSVAAGEPPTGRLVALGNGAGREESALALSDLNASERRTYDALAKTSLGKEQALNAIRNRRNN